MRLALGHDVPAQTESLYFRHVGWALSNALSTFHYGIAATPVPQAVKFDESVRLLDEAVAEGRGVVLVGPHWSAHELVAAIISRRHPMAMLVRQASSSDRATRKLKWYDALGVEIVLRPSRASAIKDAVACLKVLKRGKLLGITLDHLAGPGEGIETCVSDAPRGSTAVLSPLRSRRGRQWCESLAGGKGMRACWSCLTAHHSLSMAAIVMPPFAPAFRTGVCGLRRNCGQIQRTGYSGSTDAGHASCVRPRAGLVLLTALGVAAVALGMLWAGQSIVLKLVGEPLAWPLRFTTRKPVVRFTSRVMIHVSWLVILVGTPLALGIPPLDALRQAFPLPAPWRDIAAAFSSMFFPSSIIYAMYIQAGFARTEPQHDRAIRHAKLLRRFLGPLPLATLEEGVFRGILLEQLLRSFPRSHAYTVLAIGLSSAAFSAVHFIKRSYPGKPLLQPPYPPFIIPCLFRPASLISLPP